MIKLSTETLKKILGVILFVALTGAAALVLYAPPHVANKEAPLPFSVGQVVHTRVGNYQGIVWDISHWQCTENEPFRYNTTVDFGPGIGLKNEWFCAFELVK